MQSMKTLNEIKLQNLQMELELAIAARNNERVLELRAMIDLIKRDIELRKEMGML